MIIKVKIEMITEVVIEIMMQIRIKMIVKSIIGRITEKKMKLMIMNDERRAEIRAKIMQV